MLFGGGRALRALAPSAARGIQCGCCVAPTAPAVPAAPLCCALVRTVPSLPAAAAPGTTLVRQFSQLGSGPGGGSSGGGGVGGGVGGWDKLKCPMCGGKLNIALKASSHVSTGHVFQCEGCGGYSVIKAAPGLRLQSGASHAGISNSSTGAPGAGPRALSDFGPGQQQSGNGGGVPSANLSAAAQAAAAAEAEAEQEASTRVLSPRQLFDGLDECVIGQSEVKKTLAVGVYNHYKRLGRSARRYALHQQCTTTRRAIHSR